MAHPDRYPPFRHREITRNPSVVEYDVTIAPERLITVEMNGLSQVIVANSVVVCYEPHDFITDVNTIAERQKVPAGRLDSGINAAYMDTHEPINFPVDVAHLDSVARYFRVSMRGVLFQYLALSGHHLTANLGASLSRNEPALQDVFEMLAQAGTKRPPDDASSLSAYILDLLPEKDKSS